MGGGGGRERGMANERERTERERGAEASVGWFWFRGPQPPLPPPPPATGPPPRSSFLWDRRPAGFGPLSLPTKRHGRAGHHTAHALVGRAGVERPFPPPRQGPVRKGGRRGPSRPPAPASFFLSSTTLPTPARPACPRSIKGVRPGQCAPSWGRRQARTEPGRWRQEGPGAPSPCPPIRSPPFPLPLAPALSSHLSSWPCTSPTGPAGSGRARPGGPGRSCPGTRWRWGAWRGRAA